MPDVPCGQRFSTTFATMFRKVVTEQYPEEKDKFPEAALSRPSPAQTGTRTALKVHRLRVVLPGPVRPMRSSCEGADNKAAAGSPRRALRAGVPDQLPALHRMRTVHRGLPHPR